MPKKPQNNRKARRPTWVKPRLNGAKREPVLPDADELLDPDADTEAECDALFAEWRSIRDDNATTAADSLKVLEAMPDESANHLIIESRMFSKHVLVAMLAQVARVLKPAGKVSFVTAGEGEGLPKVER